jgi:hypothetical protein
MTFRQLVRWIKRNSVVLGIVGGALAASASGAWAVYTYMKTPEGGAYVKFKLCVAKKRSSCPPGTVWFNGAQEDVADYIRKKCDEFENGKKKAGQSTASTFSLYEVICTRGSAKADAK